MKLLNYSERLDAVSGGGNDEAEGCRKNEGRGFVEMSNGDAPAKEREARSGQEIDRGTRGLDSINVIDLLLVLARNKRLVIGTPILAALVAVIVSLLLPSQFTATTRIMPPQQSPSNSVAILGQLGVAGLASGGNLSAALRNPSDIFVALLKGSTVADKVLERFPLAKVWNAEYQEDARNLLAAHTNVIASKEGIITVDFTDTDPQRAAAVANAYIEALRELTLNLAVTEASQRRIYFERELKRANESLASATEALKKFQQSTGIISDSLLGFSAQTSATLRAQITAKEVQIASIRSFATGHNPDLVRAERELAGLQSQLSKIDKGEGKNKGGVVIAGTNIPAIAQEYARRVRDVRYHETLLDLLARQYESAKLDESRNSTLIQVFDKADAPERRSSPKRRIIVQYSALAGLVLGVILAFLRESFLRVQSDPRLTSRLLELKKYLAVQRG